MFLLLVVVVLLAAPVLAGVFIAAGEARLTELQSNTSIAENMASETGRIRQETAEIRLALNEYDHTPIEKETLLGELSRQSGIRNVELIKFSEITAPAAPATTDAESEDEEEPAPAPTLEVMIKTYAVTLKGGNTALFETLKAVEGLNDTNRITSVSWVADYVARALPRVEDDSTLLESLAKPDFLETYKLLDTEYSENAALSFTIEYFYWVDRGIDE